MSVFRVVLEKQILENYLVEANSQEEAIVMAQEGLMLTPDSTDEVSSAVVDAEKIE